MREGAVRLVALEAKRDGIPKAVVYALRVPRLQGV